MPGVCRGLCGLLGVSGVCKEGEVYVASFVYAPVDQLSIDTKLT